MRGRRDPAWRRYYNTCDRAHLAYSEGRVSIYGLRTILEQARRRAYREQEPRTTSVTTRERQAGRAIQTTE